MTNPIGFGQAIFEVLISMSKTGRDFSTTKLSVKQLQEIAFYIIISEAFEGQS
jgi:hypothetical protein